MIHEEHSQSGAAMEDTQRMIDIIDCRFQTNHFQKVWYASEENFRSDFGEPPVGLQFPIKVCDIDFYEKTNTFQAIREFSCHIYIIKEYNEYICSELRKLLSSSTNYRSLDINVFAVNGQIDEKSMLNALAHETLHSAKNTVLYGIRHPGDTKKRQRHKVC